MPDYRITAAIVASVLAIGATVLALVVLRNGQTAEYDPGGGVMKIVDLPVDATIASVNVIEHEKREGMRKVRVSLTVELNGETTREIVITEWVPVVFLGRLRVGSPVQLIKDPVDDRVTFGL